MGGLIRGYKRHLTPPSPHFARTDPLDRGLVGEWRFDPATGLMVPDYGGRGWHGSVVGGTWFNSEVGPAMNFDGNDYVYTSDMEAYIPTLGAATWEVFVNIHEDAGDNTQRGIFGWQANNGGNQHCGLNWTDEGGNRLRFDIIAGGTRTRLLGSSPAKNVWHHFVGTYDGANGYLYQDAEITDGPDAQAGNLEDNDFGAQPLNIGRSPMAGGRYLRCDVAVARLYDRALTRAEVSARREVCLKRADPMTHVWMIPWGGVVGPPPVGQPMQLRGTTVPHLRQWHPRVA